MGYTETEVAMDEFRNQPFSIEKLLFVYGNLFKDNSCGLKTEDIEFNEKRLKFIIAEKYTQLGVDYYIALEYADAIFAAIEEYKWQILKGINGIALFPKTSLLDKIKTIQSPQAIKS